MSSLVASDPSRFNDGRRHGTEMGFWRRMVPDEEPENADGEYYLPHFHRFDLEGVVDALQMLTDRCRTARSEG